MTYYNTILRKIINTLGLPFAIVSYITTFLLGVLATIPLIKWAFILIFELIFAILFVWPLFGLSYIFIKIKPLRPILGILGIVYSSFCYAIVVMLPSFGDMEERMMRLLYSFSFPFNHPLYLNMATKEIPVNYEVAEEMQLMVLKTIPISPHMVYYAQTHLYGFPWIQ